MTRPSLRLRVCAASVLLFSSSSIMAVAESDGAGTNEELGRMEKVLSDVKTVRTRFVQEQTLVLFKNTLITRGSILVEPPSKLMWRVESPIRYVLAINGKQAKQWDGETGKTQTISLDSNPVFSAVAEQLNAWFGGHYAQLAKEYDITRRSEAPAVFVFVPKPDTAPAKMLKSVAVTFREDERYIASIQIDDRGGDVTVLKFEGTEINVPLGPEEWNP
jgi:outer membrane lipoprotein-sorting protein